VCALPCGVGGVGGSVGGVSNEENRPVARPAHMQALHCLSVCSDCCTFKLLVLHPGLDEKYCLKMRMPTRILLSCTTQRSECGGRCYDPEPYPQFSAISRPFILHSQSLVPHLFPHAPLGPPPNHLTSHLMNHLTKFAVRYHMPSFCSLQYSAASPFTPL